MFGEMEIDDMKAVKMENVKGSYTMQTRETLDVVSFLFNDYITFVMEAAKGNLDKVKEWFDLIDIKHDSI